MEKDLVNVTIDNQKISVPKGITILEAAKQAGIDVPTLCFLKEINAAGDCRMCIVEIEGRRGFATSCIQKVEEGMVIKTHSPEILEARKIILDLIELMKNLRIIMKKEERVRESVRSIVS